MLLFKFEKNSNRLISFDLLDIPSELAFIYSKLDGKINFKKCIFYIKFLKQFQINYRLARVSFRQKYNAQIKRANLWFGW